MFKRWVISSSQILPGIELVMACNCTSVKGHLTKKSTVFSPSAAKYHSQSIAHDRMMKHYKFVDNAKSSIDNKPSQSANKFVGGMLRNIQIEPQTKKKLAKNTRTSVKVDELINYQLETLKIASGNMGVELQNSDHALQEDEENLELMTEETEYDDFASDLLPIHSMADGRTDLSLLGENSFTIKGESSKLSISPVGREILTIKGNIAKMKEKEHMIIEEQRYLDFIQNLTEDIIARGVFSDRVLCNVFEAHVKRNMGVLDEERMKSLIEELKCDLNIN